MLRPYPFSKVLARASPGTDRRAPPACRRPRRGAMSSVAVAAVVPCRHPLHVHACAHGPSSCTPAAPPIGPMERASTKHMPRGQIEQPSVELRAPPASTVSLRIATAAINDGTFYLGSWNTSPTRKAGGGDLGGAAAGRVGNGAGRVGLQGWTVNEIPSTPGHRPSVGSGLSGRDRRGWRSQAFAAFHAQPPAVVPFDETQRIARRRCAGVEPQQPASEMRDDAAWRRRRLLASSTPSPAPARRRR
jgi:hypothetical protein